MMIISDEVIDDWQYSIGIDYWLLLVLLMTDDIWRGNIIGNDIIVIDWYYCYYYYCYYYFIIDYWLKLLLLLLVLLVCVIVWWHVQTDNININVCQWQY